MRISSWNVNGIRHVITTGDLAGWLESSSPDIAGFQEVKAAPAQVEERPWQALGYREWWHPAERAGYSGILLLSKVEPLDVRIGLGIHEYDCEGRVIEAEFPAFTLLATYFPNGQKKNVRVPFKLRFIEAFFERIETLRAQGRPIVFVGDLNVAHTEHDLARPNEALGKTGFLPEEQAWIDRFIDAGYIDTFRHLHPDDFDAYTFWDPWRDRRARNVGWRIDYVFISGDLRPRLTAAVVESQIMGSDHCPVSIDLDLG